MKARFRQFPEVRIARHRDAEMRYSASATCEAKAAMADPFDAGSGVIVTLNMPREKFWGSLLALTPAGASLRGIDLNSLEDFARQVRDGDEVNANIVFFPMHRIERIESDARNGEIPSLQERFANKTGREFNSLAPSE